MYANKKIENTKQSATHQSHTIIISKGKASLLMQHHSYIRQFKVLYKGIKNTLKMRYEENIKVAFKR